MADEMVFYCNPMSRARMVRWMLEEIGAPYRAEVLSYGPTMKAPDYLAINPMGKVPALVHGGRVVTEVAAICAYLADVFPEAGLAPPPAERAAYYRWMFFAAGPLEQAVTNTALGVAVPEDKRGWVGYGGALAPVLDALETAVTDRTYIAADYFTAADVYVGSHLGWGMMFDSIPKRPAFVAYWQGLKDRPARRAAEALDDAAMAASQAAAGAS